MKRLIIIGALVLVGLAFARSFGWLDRHQHDTQDWTWQGELPDDGWIRVRNSNGPVRIEEGGAEGIAIEAKKSWKGRRPQDVSYVARQIGNDLYICALYGGDGECDEKRYRSSSVSWFKRKILNVKPVQVTFTVHVAPGRQVDVETVNGNVTTEIPLAAVKLETVNGSITMQEPAGALAISTVNGRVRAMAAPQAGALGPVAIENVNGTITLELADSIGAQVEMETVNGRVTSEFTFASAERNERKHVRGQLGLGGPKVSLETVNGNVQLRRIKDAEHDHEEKRTAVRVEAGPAPAPAPAPPATPEAPR